jgi:hypothetical protein
MLQIGLYLLALMTGGVIVALYAASRAPKGYEDESGFHFGPETPQRVEAEHFPAAVPQPSR